jgi:hypothetical protein
LKKSPGNRIYQARLRRQPFEFPDGMTEHVRKALFVGFSWSWVHLKFS